MNEMNDQQNEETRIKRDRLLKSPQVFVYLLLLVISGILFVGATVFKNSISESVFDLLMGIGIAIGPAALLALLFRFFLLEDVKRELLSPLSDLEEKTTKSLELRVDTSFKPILERVELLQRLERLGFVAIYDNRAAALRSESQFFQHLIGESGNAMIVGSSLRGLLQEEVYKHFQEIIIKDITKWKFLLTHPCVANLRAFQEQKKMGDIPKKIIRSLELLRDLHVKPESVRLLKCAPTCFGIKTESRMLINPYTYKRQAMDFPCFELASDHPVYDAFSAAIFEAFESTALVESFEDFDEKIKQLKEKSNQYSKNTSILLEE